MGALARMKAARLEAQLLELEYGYRGVPVPHQDIDESHGRVRGRFGQMPQMGTQEEAQLIILSVGRGVRRQMSDAKALVREGHSAFFVAKHLTTTGDESLNIANAATENPCGMVLVRTAQQESLEVPVRGVIR
jgi:hypothetical protein